MAGFRKRYTDTTPEPKEFATSYSKIRDFETCPRRYYTVAVMKQYKEQTTELDRGNRLHDAMKKAVQGGAPLPREFSYMDKWVPALIEETHPLQIIQCELQLACTRD